MPLSKRAIESPTGQETAAKVADWSRFRQLMPIAEKWVYFDHAAVAPLSVKAQEAIQNWLQGAVQDGDTVWPKWVREVEQARVSAAQLLHAETDEIAFVANTTTGITFVAEGIPWQSGDNVVTLANEFPTNQYPWLNLAERGVETRRIAVEGSGLDLQNLVQAIDSRTRLVSVSWVGFATGWRLNLDEVVDLVHSRGALFCLDAIQGLGVFPLDVRRTPVDFLAADGHKWLLGPEGAGLLFIRREHLERLRPINVGWNSVTQGNDYSKIELNLRPTAARYEGGSQNMVGTIALGASLQLLASFGLGAEQSLIADRVLEITDLACARLEECGARIVSRRDAEHSSGIVAFDWPQGDPQLLRKHCLANHIVLSCRGGHLRISPHAYNNADDIERLIEALRSAP
jgi:selenocysteine lyase/cysteine desulfurase